MKKGILAVVTTIIVAASANAQSTVDSIASKYKYLSMPEARTAEKTFPVLGTYQLTDATAGTGTLTVTPDPTNKGIVWVEGLPQGKVKAYLRKRPTTYRIVPQQSESGTQVSEGTLHYDTTSHELHIALGKAYDETDPTAIFAMSPDGQANASADSETETKIKTDEGKVKTETEGNKVKMKTKTATTKEKTKLVFYTATKVMAESTTPEAMQTQPSDSTQHQ